MTTAEKIAALDAHLGRRYVERGEFLSDSDLLDGLDMVAPLTHYTAGGRCLTDEEWHAANLFVLAQREAIVTAVEGRWFEGR